MKLQRQLSNGKWIDDDRDEYWLGKLFDAILKRESRMAVHQNRQPMTTHQELIDYLATGKTLQYDDDWYANVRDGEVFARKLEAARQKRDNDPNYSNQGWRLDCGHIVHHRSHIMSANMGTACENCYDRMSE